MWTVCLNWTISFYEVEKKTEKFQIVYKITYVENLLVHSQLKRITNAFLLKVPSTTQRILATSILLAFLTVNLFSYVRKYWIIVILYLLTSTEYLMYFSPLTSKIVFQFWSAISSQPRLETTFPISHIAIDSDKILT